MNPPPDLRNKAGTIPHTWQKQAITYLSTWES